MKDIWEMMDWLDQIKRNGVIDHYRFVATSLLDGGVKIRYNKSINGGTKLAVADKLSQHWPTHIYLVDNG